VWGVRARLARVRRDDAVVRVRVPFDAGAALGYLAVHLVPGVERLTVTSPADGAPPTAGRVERLVRTPDGGTALLVAELADDQVVAHLARPDERAVPASQDPDAPGGPPTSAASGTGTPKPATRDTATSGTATSGTATSGTATSGTGMSGTGTTGTTGAGRTGVGAADVAWVVPALERWFGLADDVAAAAEHLRRDEALRPLVAARPHLRVPGHVDGFEVAAQTVLGQQVSLAAARTFTGRLAEALGTPGPSGLTLFPDAATVAAADPDALRPVLRVPAARVRTLVAVAAACADGLDLSPAADPDATRARLLALPGVGPWTADYLALRALGDRDVLPAGDLVLRQAFALVPAPELARRAVPWSPWRAFAAQHVWSAALAARLTRAAATSRARGRRSPTARPRA